MPGADSGEDAIAFSSTGNYAANVELADAMPPSHDRPPATEDITTIDTPDVHSIEEVCKFLKTSPDHCLKTLLVQGVDGQVVALVLRLANHA